MKEQYRHWLNAIERFEMPEYEKQEYLGIVRSLSKTGAPVILNHKHLSLLIGIDPSELRKMYNARDRFYRSYVIKKRNGGERLIEAPYPSLKMVQRWILDNILTPTATVYPFSIAFTKGKTVVDNAKPHLGTNVLLKMDIKDFFPSIRESFVYEYFKSLGYNHRLSSTLSYLCCKDSKLPQGAPTSPILSNVLYHGMDTCLAQLAYQEDLSYTRYADDLTFSGNAIPIPVFYSVSKIVKSFHLMINEDKTRRSGKGSRKIITGVSISAGRITIPRERKRAIRQKVHYILAYGLLDHLRHIQSRDLLAGYRLLGELAYWRSIEPENKYVLSAFNGIKNMLQHDK